MAIFEEPAATPTPGALVLRYTLVLGAIGLALIALMAFVGWLIAFFVPALFLVAVVSARLGAAAGWLALVAPVVLAVVWAAASIGMAILAFPDDALSQGWTILFFVLGVASTVIIIFISVFVGAGGAADLRHTRKRRAEQASGSPFGR